MWMKTSLALFLVVNGAGACSIIRDYGSGSSLNTAEVVNFNVAPAALTSCSVNCDSGGALTTLFVRYGGSASAIFNDGSSFSLTGCGSQVDIISVDEEYELGFALEVNTPYTNVTLMCTCAQEGDGDDRGLGCFSESSTVEVLNQGTVAMKNLQVGDKVLSGENKYEPVYGFGHHLEDAEQDFVQVHHTKSSEPLELTADHMIFVADKTGKESAVRADALNVGDVLVGSDGVSVTNIATIQKQGMYMPLTPSGTIMVNGVKASAYISVQEDAPAVVENKSFFGMESEDTLIHMWLSPMRMLCMGVSAKFCGIPRDDPQALASERGIMGWLLYGRQFVMLMEHQSFAVRVFGLGLPAFLVFGSFNLLESVFGPALAPSAVAMIVAGLVWLNQKKRQNRDLTKKVA